MDDDTGRPAARLARLDLGAKMVMGAVVGGILGLVASLTLVYVLLAWVWGGEGSS